MKQSLLLSTLLLLYSLVFSQQARVVEGTITSAEDGSPLVSASVIVNGTTTGVFSDIDGKYRISFLDTASTLTFTYTGYERKIVQLDGSPILNVALQLKNSTLDEIVIVGYGEQKKANLTGAVENISVKDVGTRVLTDASQIIQGKVAGVQIVQNSGQPGDQGAEIRIRGVASIENGNQPLIIIDGVIGELSDVNPNDIETMTVLKDASAAAIYGVRASAGVVLIKTKRGTKNIRVNFNSSISFSTPSQLPTPVDGITYAERLNEARVNFGFAPIYNDFDLDTIRLGLSDRFQNNDWYDLFFETGTVQNYYGSVSGGGENHDFSLSAGYLDQEGILFGTSSNKVTYRAVINTYFAKDRIRIGAIVQGNDENVKELSSSTTSVLTRASLASPLSAFSFDDEQGNTFYTFNSRFFAEEEVGGGRFIDRRNNKYQFEAEVEPIKNLKLLSRYSQTIYDTQSERLVPAVLTATGANLDILSLRRSSTETVFSKTQNMLWTSLITYDLEFGSNQRLSALAGYERIYNKFEQTRMGINDLLANEPIISLGDPAEIYFSDNASEVSQVSYFARLTYNFRERYLFEANFRRDASSRFNPAGNSAENATPFANFPSFSVGWRISEEAFFNVASVSQLKLRASWGQLGNESIRDRYPLFSQQTPGYNYTFGGQLVPGSATTKLAAPIFWERSEQVNIGLDLELFERLGLLANVYNKVSRDNLIRVTIPLSLGTNELPFQNIGTMRNRGVEGTLTYHTDLVRPVVFFATLNASYNENEVLDLGDLDFVRHDDDIVSGYLPPAGIIRSAVGGSFASFYGYRFDRIYQISDFTWQRDSDPTIPHEDRNYRLIEDLPNPSNLYSNVAPGDIKYQDLNGDGDLNEDDVTLIGTSQPNWIYSGSLSLRVKNFTLSTLFQGQQGGQAYLIGGLVSPFWGGAAPISQDLADNRWTPENASTTHERLHVDAKRATVVSDYYLQDASYFRVKNVRLEYDFPENLLSKMHFSSLRLYGTVENVLTLTNFEGFDPERSTFKITSDFHPQLVIYSFGLNASL
ncbi:MAG: TonB-dependent receptor [Bacteroidota bacterium]